MIASWVKTHLCLLEPGPSLRPPRETLIVGAAACCLRAGPRTALHTRSSTRAEPPYTRAHAGQRTRSDRRRRLRHQCARAGLHRGTLMRHLREKIDATATDAGGTRPGAPRVSRAHEPSAGSAGPPRAPTRVDQNHCTPHCNSTGLDHTTSRPPLPAHRTGKGRTGNPPESSCRAAKDWTSVPFPATLSTCGTMPRVGRPRGDRQVFCPWAFGLFMPGSCLSDGRRMIQPHSVSATKVLTRSGPNSGSNQSRVTSGE